MARLAKARNDDGHETSGPDSAPPGSDRQGSDRASSDRLDKWLWHVRLVRTRTMASELVSGGHVRVGSVRIDKPGYAIKTGDVVTVVLRTGVRVLKVNGFADRRGDTAAAALLFEDLAPPVPRAPAGPKPQRESGLREPGSGRPTKRDRRQIDRLKFRST